MSILVYTSLGYIKNIYIYIYHPSMIAVTRSDIKRSLISERDLQQSMVAASCGRYEPRLSKTEINASVVAASL